jgi:hypothetical protein
MQFAIASLLQTQPLYGKRQSTAEPPDCINNAERRDAFTTVTQDAAIPSRVTNSENSEQKLLPRRQQTLHAMVTTPLRITGLQIRYAPTRLKSPPEQRCAKSCKSAQQNAMNIITRVTNAKLTHMTLARM